MIHIENLVKRYGDLFLFIAYLGIRMERYDSI